MILITAFEPFDKRDHNQSLEILQKLDARYQKSGFAGISI